MKIALIRQKYTPFGGAERYMARLIDGLAAEGHDVHVLAAKWDSDGRQKVVFHRVPVIKFPGWLKNLTFSVNCLRLLKRESFDVVFSLERTLRQDIYRAGDGCHRQWLKQKNLGKGFFARVATYMNPLQLAYMFLEKMLFTDPDLHSIIANSQRGKKEIIDLYGVNPDKISVVYNGVNSTEVTGEMRETCRSSLSAKYGTGSELLILYVGSGFRRKGVPVLLEAVALLDIPFHLFIVGKERLFPYKRQAERLGISKKVTFTGPITEIDTFYHGCDIFAFPTLYDPFSNATLEAMACGLPVITSRYNGVAELIVDDQSGYVLTDPCDAVRLAAVITALEPPDVRQRLRRGSIEAARPFTMEKNVRETLAIIKAVAG